MSAIPFNSDELVSKGSYPGGRYGMPDVKIYNTPITPLENYLRLYNKQVPLWIPIPNDRRTISPFIDPDAVARCFVMDYKYQMPEEMVGGKDKHGIEWVYIESAGGSMVRPGSPTLLDANDWEKVISFPDIASWDWAGAKANFADQLAADNRLICVTMLTGFFERLISMMDFENAAVALIDDEQKDAVKALFDRLADMYIEMIGRYKDAFGIQQVNLHDDWGSQRSPFFSLDTVLEMIVPALSKVVDATKSMGIIFDQHSCGKNEKLVPAYIAAGVQSWSGQPMNDKDWIYENYGDKIILGLNSDLVLTPETTDDEVVASAKRFVAKYGPTMESKPFLCAGPGNDLFYDVLYEESRKLFGSFVQA